VRMRLRWLLFQSAAAPPALMPFLPVLMPPPHACLPAGLPAPMQQDPPGIEPENESLETVSAWQQAGPLGKLGAAALPCAPVVPLTAMLVGSPSTASRPNTATLKGQHRLPT